ncbi:ABC transporter ATP-binding protein [Flavitalea flava]
MKPIIEIHQLSKKYRLQKRANYLSLRDLMADSFKNLFLANLNQATDFWALKDINLTIQPGERIGIIGNNGAGKTTLLKILSRITPPSEGKINIRGKIASLLEVGTGFHPELTGRENIYMNGSILGLKKHEIDNQFDAIVDFSGVSAFLETPLKNYSSGMGLRLGFAVAAHLKPDILIIDEVLAVGDLEFQKKCLGKMEEISKEQGRTILFVSHNMAAITSLCEKAIHLQKGHLYSVGHSTAIVQEYIKISESYVNSVYNNLNTTTLKPIFFTKVFASDEAGSLKQYFQIEEDIHIHIQIENHSWNRAFTIGISLNDTSNRKISIDNIYYSGDQITKTINLQAKIPKNVLTPNRYLIDLAIELPGIEVIDYIKNVINFDIIKTGTGFEGLNYEYGVIAKIFEWKR